MDFLDLFEAAKVPFYDGMGAYVVILYHHVERISFNRMHDS